MVIIIRNDTKRRNTVKGKSKVLNYFIPTSTGDRLAYIALIITVVFGFWGIRLTYKSIDASIDIQHFDTLLSKTDSSLSDQAKLLSANGTLINLSQKQIDSLVSINKTLTNQFSVLSKQYNISLQEQELLNINNKNIKASNEARFYVATQNLHLLTWEPNIYPSYLSDWTISSRIDFLNKATEILNGQLDNPYLLSNKYMLQDWLNVRDSVFRYRADIQFLPQQPMDTLNFEGVLYPELQLTLKREWRNSFVKVAELEQSTSAFMTYYTFRGRNKVRPQDSTYKQIIKLQRQ
jgi:hypothetical protein